MYSNSVRAYGIVFGVPYNYSFNLRHGIYRVFNCLICKKLSPVMGYNIENMYFAIGLSQLHIIWRTSGNTALKQNNRLFYLIGNSHIYKSFE